MLAILLQIQLLSSYNGPIPSLVCNWLKGSNTCDDVNDVISLMYTTDFTYSDLWQLWAYVRVRVCDFKKGWWWVDLLN